MNNSLKNQNNSSNAHIMWEFELLVVWTTTRGTTCNSSNDQLFKKSIVQTGMPNLQQFPGLKPMQII